MNVLLSEGSDFIFSNEVWTVIFRQEIGVMLADHHIDTLMVHQLIYI